MISSIESIGLDKLLAHPDNPNRMSKVNFAKLVRNIERTGIYEPLIVRPLSRKEGCFQIINGEHRYHALTKLGYKKAECIVWDIDDEQADVFLATLNRLGGSDEVSKKLALLKRLNKKMAAAKLAKILPYKQKQIERLSNLKMPRAAAKISAKNFATAMVFFVNDKQKQVIEDALSLAKEPTVKMTKAAKRAEELAQIAGYFLKHWKN